MQNEKIFIYTVQQNQRNFARNSFKLKKLWFNIVISNRFSSGHHLTIWSLSGKPFCLKMLLELHAQKRNLIGADRQNLLKNTTIAPGEVQTYAYFNSIAIFNNRCCNTNQRSFVSFFFLQWSIVEFLIFGHSKWQNRMLNACFGQLNSTLYMQATQVTYVKRIVKHSLWLFRTNKHRLRKPTSAWLNTDWIHKQLSTKITIKTKSILFGLKLWLFNC